MSRSFPVIVGALWLAGCSGPQSTLDPAGVGAERIAWLFWWMAAGAVVIWLAVAGLAVYAHRVRPGPHDERKTTLLIIGGGALFPTVVLGVLLSFGLAEMPGLLAPAPEGSLRIAVSGEQWWWRVRYEPPDGEPFELANEIRLPVGESVQFLLDSPDVIHSFWVPSLGGKMDMIPGRVTELALEPTKTGTFRGACAEYCGGPHALMSFYVVVEEREDFARWLAHQRTPARPPAGALAVRGRELFLANGCGACHTVRGTPADGVVGPDLTHVGSRVSLGAGILPNRHDQFLRWVARTDDVKPGVHMPEFGMLPPGELRALAAFLEGLE
ncbi:MAG TPA: cytochrome c oxidase subunit II [Thermoanaerobaculia bacterium]|nr:cytochrome c oxidase subunit II [Thermoanaerobaculia bacterium]